MHAIFNYSINFKSNPQRERELERLRELQRERERIRQLEHERELARRREEARAKRERERQHEEAVQKQRDDVLTEMVREIRAYPDIDNEMSTKMAGFLSQFTCAIQNDSEHNVMEFFGNEETAENLRNNLSSECKHDSIELRNEIQKLDEMKDPVMMLLCANRMNRFVPKKGILSDDQYKRIIDGIKETITTSIMNTDLDKFYAEDRSAILEMVQMIKASDSVDFGISVKLKLLVDKLNKKALKLNFIPPVTVRNLENITQTIRI